MAPRHGGRAMPCQEERNFFQHPAKELLLLLPHESGEIFILVRGDQIDTRVQRRLPADGRGFTGAKIVARLPTLIVGGAEAIKSIKSNPESLRMGVIQEFAQTAGVCRGPVAGLRLPPFFDFEPGIVPPTAIVRGTLRQEL